MREDVKAALSELQDKHGNLLPEDVVERAKSANSPLHDLFEWNKDKAAMAHWIATARNIIGEYRVVIHVMNTTREVRAFVHDPDAGRDAGYISTERLKNDASRASAVLLTEARRCRSHLDTMVALAAYWQRPHPELATALKKIESFVTRLEGDRS